MSSSLRAVPARLAWAAALALTVCGGAAQAQTELVIATVNNGHMIEMQKLSKNFEQANPDITLKWVTLEEGVLRQRVTTDIATKGGQFDVMTIGMYETPIWGKKGWLQELKKSSEKHGVKILASETYSPKDTSVTAQVIKLAAANPEMVVIGAGPGGNTLLDCRSVVVPGGAPIGVLDAVGADAVGRHVDAGYVRDVFTDQINVTEGIEYTRFAQWKFDPATSPSTAPDLASSRSQIDGYNRTMVEQIALQWNSLHSPGCAADLAAARDAVAGERGLDPFYRDALAAATRSYCRIT